MITLDFPNFDRSLVESERHYKAVIKHATLSAFPLQKSKYHCKTQVGKRNPFTKRVTAEFWCCFGQFDSSTQIIHGQHK